MFPPHPLRCALNDSVASGVFIDTKFYLFSHRNSAGKTCRPRPLYANSLTLGSVPYFKDLLSGGFAEGATKSLDHDPFEDPDHVEDYDYISDSDLEDDPGVAEPVTKNQLPRGKDQRSSVGENELKHHGKVVVMRGVSYLTFQAIVMYLYTDEIDFAPFGSKANRELRKPELLSTADGTIPRPSPKSVYRIADMYDIPKLKELAFTAIKNGIKSCDAVEETFSKFTSRYPEMVDLHAENLVSKLLSSDSNSQDVQERLDKKLRSFANREILHAANAVSALFGILAQDPTSDIPPKTKDTNPQAGPKCTWAGGDNQDIPPHQKSMNIALIKSMHHGLFLDLVYRVRKRRSGSDQFASIHLSSTIFHSVRSKLDALTHASDSTVGEGEQEVDCDSDCEDPTLGFTESAANNPAQGGPAPCHNFLPGTLTTWKFLFVYLCFNEITFGPLRAQEAFLENKRSTSEALSCSPKSIYHVAQLLGLDPLADLAFNDIVSKLTSDNIVAELFSTFTAHNGKLMEKQSSLITSTLKTSTTTAAVQRYIQEIGSDTSPHRYDALPLVFGNTVNAIKRKRQEIVDEWVARVEAKFTPQPMLRCEGSSPDCLCHASFDAAGGNIWCWYCGGRLRCTICNTLWGGGQAFHGCNKTFR